MLRSLFRLLLKMSLAIALLLTMGVLHSQTDAARGAARALLCTLVSNAMVGDLHIAQVTELGRNGLFARDVTLYDGQGQEVIFVRHLELRFGSYDFSTGLLEFPRAQLHDGRITLRPQSDGLPTLVGALAPEERIDTAPSFLTDWLSSIAPRGASITNISLHDVQIAGELLGLAGVAGTAQGGTLHIKAASDIDVDFEHVHGLLSQPFGFDARIVDLTGRLSSRPESQVDLRAQVSRDDEEARASIFFGAKSPNSEPDLIIDVATTHLSIDTLTRLGYDFLSPIKSDVSGELHVGGPVDSLDLHAEVQSDGGPITISASLGQPLQVQVQSDALRLDQAINGAPGVTVSGMVTLTQYSDKPGIFVHADMGPTTMAGLLVPSFQADGTLLDDAFVLEKLSAKTPGSRLRGSGKLLFDGPANFHIAAHFDDMGRDENLHKLVPDARGSLDAELRISIPKLGDAPINIQGTLDSQNLRYAGISATQVHSKLRLRGSLERPELSMDAKATGLLLGAYAVGDGTMTVSGGPTSYAIAGDFKKSGARNFALTGQLQVDNQGMTLSAESLELAVGKDTFRGSLSGLRLVADKTLRVDRLLLANRSQRLEASGALSKSGQETFTAQLQNFELAAVAALVGPDFPLRQGRADATLEVTGDLDKPRLQLQGLLHDVSALGMDNLQALYLLSYDGHAIELDGELDMGDRGSLRVLGSGAVTERIQDPTEALLSANYSMTLEVKNVDLAAMPWFTGLAQSGRLDAQLNVLGNRQDPQIDGTFAVTSLSMAASNPLDLAGSLSYRTNVFQLETSATDPEGALGQASVSAEVAVASLLAGASLSDAWPPVFSFSAHLESRSSENLPPVLTQWLEIPMTVGGDVSLSRNHGPLTGEAHAVALLESAADASCAQKTQTRLHINAEVRDGRAVFDAAAYLHSKRLASATGTALVPLDNLLTGQSITPSHVSFSGEVDLPNIAQVPHICDLATGSAAGRVEAHDLLSSNPTFRGELHSKFFPPGIARSTRGQIEIRSCGNDPARLDVTFNGHNKSGFLYGTLGGCGGGNARISGLAPLVWTEAMLVPAWKPDEDINLTIQFKNTQLRAVLDRIPGIQTGEAVANGNLRISGPIDGLHYWGEINLQRGRLKVVGTGQTIEDVSSKIVFREHAATLEKFQGRANEGTVELKGGFNFVGLSPRHAQMVVTLDKFPLRREGIKLAWLTGSAALESHFDDERSRTVVAIRTLEARLPPQTPNTLQALEANPDVVVVEDKGMKPRAKPYVLDFQIRSDRPILIVRDDFEAAIHSELAVDYADPDLRMAGFLEFRRGSFQVFGKNFNLIQGGLRFDGRTEIDPEVNLVATHTVPNSQEQVTVVVRGHLSSPDIRFTSEACEGQSGALTLLVTGRCTEDPNSPTQSSDTESAFAAGLLQGVLTLGARRELGDIIPNLAVESGQRGYATRVRAGIESESVIPKFMRPYVRKVYLQGAVSTARTQADTEVANQDASLDFLLQLYFPNNIVSSGHFAVNRWGMDLTWEP